LLAQKCHVILVFDGRPLPAKKDCNDSRREMRKGYQQLGEQLMRQGLTSEADRAFTRGTEITREVVEKTIKVGNKKKSIFIFIFGI
jgi:5'-3' exonuclease